MLSTGAFNALLKTLEEPPSHAVFILATTESQKIPATILSRCMRFDFKLIPQADLEERLRYVFKEIGKAYEEEAVSAIARAGAGSVRDMLSLADTCVSYSAGKLTYADVNAVLGNADFAEVGKLCKAVLTGDNGLAFEKAENFLAAGKSVGMLLKDVLNYLNACAVAKTCRDGKAILALPDQPYNEVLEVAKSADGHRLLRVTEIFAKVESEVKYSVSPRILFETAVMKASFPQEDYDMESLIARIVSLEQKVKDGAFTAAPTTAPQTVAQATEKATPSVQAQPTEEAYETDVPPALEAPPEEEGNVYFDAPVKQVEKLKTEAQSIPTPSVLPVKPSKPVALGNEKATFGSFLRSIRKTAKNGVLIALCMDLDGGYEDGVFVLSTESDTVYRSLHKPEHFALVTQAFAAIGVEEGGFAIALKGKKADGFDKSAEEVKKTFDGVKIEIT